MRIMFARCARSPSDAKAVRGLAGSVRAKRSRFLYAAVAHALATLCGLALAAPGWSIGSNVVLITIDTVRADHVGCYGYPQAHTPNLDALARNGILFRTVVASVPLTLPSHCSILTGTYPTLHGVRDNLGYNLGDSPPTLATILKQHGYATAAFIGADVLGARRGLNRGFDTYSAPFRRPRGRDNPLVFNLQELQRRAEDVISDALKWMAAQPAHSGKPFFVWIHLYDPHTPYDPPPRFRALLRNPYDGEIAYADDSLGKFFDYLKQHDLYDSTLIVATSDHGESFGEHGEYTHGYFIYDTTLLVPLIIKPPLGLSITPRAIEDPVRTIDIAPTVLQFLTLAPPPAMQGAGLLSAIMGKTTSAPPGATYCETYYPNEFGWSTLRALRSGRFKYIDAPKPELYDLVKDPQETHNLYQSKQATALELKSRFESLLTRITPQGPSRRTPISRADIEALVSLGYVGTLSSGLLGTPGHALPDPKDELGAYKILSSTAQMAAQGKCARAIPLLSRLTQDQPALLLGHLTLAKCELSLGKYEAAESALNAALRLRPDNLEAMFYRGIVQFQQGRLPDSLSSLEKVAKVLQDEPYLHFYLGSIYEQQGAAERALAEFQKCAALDPTFEVAVFKIGFYLARSGKFADAITEFKKVCALDPSNADAHYNLGLAYARVDNPGAAREERATACCLKPALCADETIR